MDDRISVVGWVSSQVLPHEADVRRWLSRYPGMGDKDDLIQEVYCRMAALERVDHITNGRAYFFQAVRNLIYERVRRARLIPIEVVAELDALGASSDQPDPERSAGAQRELVLVKRLISKLPDRCRRVFELRKMEGVPQREIARRLGVSENVVENEVRRGLRLILQALEQQGVDLAVEPNYRAVGRAREL